MKKTILSLALAISILLVAGITANAEERTELNPEKRFSQRFEERQQKRENLLAERAADLEEKKLAAKERQKKKLELINHYAEDMVGSYVEAFEGHVTVHELLFEEHKSLRLEAHEITQAGVIELKETLKPQVEADTLTIKQMRAKIKTYLEGQKTNFSVIREQYQADIEGLNAENKANKEMASGLRLDLRAAIEADDQAESKAIISELYNHLLQHIQYDYDKLEILEKVEF